MTKSLYEQLFPLTTVMKQRFVDNFDGSSINESWVENNIAGVNTVAISDTIDGGLSITTGGTNLNGLYLDFGTIHQFSPTASRYIEIDKMPSAGASQIHYIGLVTEAVADDIANHRADDAVNANFMVLVAENNIGTNVITDLVLDANYHVKQADLQSSVIDFRIDNVLKASPTTNLPNSPLQPIMYTRNRSGVKVDNYLYFEAYNT